MILPFESLAGPNEQFGYVLAVLIGFAFGFVLERAGFGYATKLAAQFYLYDMTVFKVMFTAIVTAMLGVAVADGLGLTEFDMLARQVVSDTYLWPMILGGLLLGVGFIVSGYCPGTSLVAAASGHIDGMLTFAGVVAGSLLFGELYPWVAQFYNSGHLGQVFLYELLGLRPAVVAAGVTVMAIACFIGAEWLERLASRKLLGQGAITVQATSGQKRIAFAYCIAAAAAALFLTFAPTKGKAAAETREIKHIDVLNLAQRLIEEPWRLWLIDVRDQQQYLKTRIPHSEHVAAEELPALGLQYSSGVRDLVLITESGDVPEAAMEAVQRYPGKVFVLSGGFAAWRRFVLEPPPELPPDATDAERQAFRLRAGLHAAFTGAPPPPPPKSTIKFKPPPKRKSGGCI